MQKKKRIPSWKALRTKNIEKFAMYTKLCLSISPVENFQYFKKSESFVNSYLEKKSLTNVGAFKPIEPIRSNKLLWLRLLVILV